MKKVSLKNLSFKDNEAERNSRLSKELGVPVFYVHKMHVFNQIIGYARFINASVGTVLYRGQDWNYPKLIPSGLRNGHTPVPEKLIADIRDDQALRNLFKFDQPDIKGWEQYEKLLVEAILQHYGAYTHCMDFVDNHWSALWFGLNKFKNNHYHKRADDEHLYVYLYVADTNGPCVRGVYIGTDTLTIDLRKAAPSIFQRPASQHGWIVRNRDGKVQDLNDGLLAILEVDVPTAAEWLGEGTLLSEANFFPPFSDDQGYRVLLERQIRSGLPAKSKRYGKFLPIDTIQNYHYSKLFYSEKESSSFTPSCNSEYCNNESDDPLTDMASWLWRFGWQRETCIQEEVWREENPVFGQSAATAFLVQRYFGGEIVTIQYSKRLHYFNRINGKLVDLTQGELQRNNREYYREAVELSKRQRNKTNRFCELAEMLDKNCIMASASSADRLRI